MPHLKDFKYKISKKTFSGLHDSTNENDAMYIHWNV